MRVIHKDFVIPPVRAKPDAEQYGLTTFPIKTRLKNIGTPTEE